MFSGPDCFQSKGFELRKAARALDSAQKFEKVHLGYNEEVGYLARVLTDIGKLITSHEIQLIW